jgi:hypothetical protein
MPGLKQFKYKVFQSKIQNPKSKIAIIYADIKAPRVERTRSQRKEISRKE